MNLKPIIAAALLLLTTSVGPAEEAPDASNPRVTLVTALGEIELELFEARAPQTTRFFLDLIESGAYDGTAFYRSTSLENEDGARLIQGGPLHDVLTGRRPRLVEYSAAEKLATIESTSVTGLKHTEGTVSMARDLAATGHVLPDLFICLGDFPELDEGGRTRPDTKGFPAFGRVTSGLGVVRRIAESPRDGVTWAGRLKGEILTEPVVIESVSVQGGERGR